MKKRLTLAIVVLSALSLLQCQYAKQMLDDLNKAASEKEDEKGEDASSSSYKIEKSSSSIIEKSSSSESKKARKEAN
ncbi:hypothetical protein R83H12_01427 [Fibrobacteria bacterium R8-3-H12]